ncbi:unnamed protein product [Darwinula stevensoni]|uniref:Peroxinectin n=1 Tax=Darwinula stevensoni TaxID=69355 RepID=A0A7R9AAK3_9CRUS|nr:unnamed protein product [Darwinula stevensoni]CAG0898518.1 unnamed protein product [Darwinula stevensoni]
MELMLGGAGLIAFRGRAQSPPQALVDLDAPCKTKDGMPGFCTFHVACSAFYLASSECSLGNGVPGICCPLEPSVSSGRDGLVIHDETKRDVSVREFTQRQLDEAMLFGVQMVSHLDRISSQLLNRGMVVQPGTPAGFHQRFFQTEKKAIRLAKDALVGVEAARNLSRRFDLSPDQTTFGLSKYSMLRTSGSGTCPDPPTCDPGSRFRSPDGSCNNLRVPQAGQSRTAMQRLLRPAYADGVSSPRVAVSGRELPSARTVSKTLVPDRDRPNLQLTLMTMQWGQFVDHDITFAPIFKLDDQGSEGISCCQNGNVINPPPHPECFPIQISPQDPFYGPLQQRCMNFVRSLPAPRPDCSFGPREQMNQITSWLDGNSVYGSDDDAAKKLRAFQDGLMKTSEIDGRSLLPPESVGSTKRQMGTPKFAAGRAVSVLDSSSLTGPASIGDTRVNEVASLSVMHTIFVRQHNRIARELQQLNQFWDDETLYQEARRIVGAQLQHITYNEWLPIVLVILNCDCFSGSLSISSHAGSRFMNYFGIRTGQSGYRFNYDPSINPSVTNEFAVAAFRFGHTLIQGLLKVRHGLTDFDRLFGGGGQSETQRLRDLFENPSLLYARSGVDRFVNALVTQSIQSFDQFVTSEVTEHLFQNRSQSFGMDLVSLNLQRGRDHGVRGYNDYRQMCSLGRAGSFDRFYPQIPRNTIQEMKKVYESVDDVDLFVGGISETPVPGALLGPTFHCIVGDMFLRLQKGDRFFYDIGDQPHSFTPGDY